MTAPRKPSVPRNRPVTIECENTAGVPLGSSLGYEAFETITSCTPAAIALLNGADVRALAIGPKDAVVAVSASGVTPYTLAALEAARAAGALCVAIVCTPDSMIASVAEHEVRVLVGPEVVSGSTRLKAGTAQKLVLNAISTATMIRLGRTYDGLMVGVAPENAKLRERARRNAVIASGRSEADVDEALTAAGGDARVALVALLAGVDPATARERLAGTGGSVSVALGGRP